MRIFFIFILRRVNFFIEFDFIAQTDEAYVASNSNGGTGETGSTISPGAPGNQIATEKDNSASLSVGAQETAPATAATHGGLLIERSPSAISDTSKTSSDMVVSFVSSQYISIQFSVRITSSTTSQKEKIECTSRKKLLITKKT